MIQLDNWVIALGTVAGVAVTYFGARGVGRAEAERYSREQSKEKEEAKLALAIWQTEIKLKVDEMWNHMQRRGEVAAVLNGWGSLKSPLVANERARFALEPLMRDIMEFYRAKGVKLDPVLLRASMEEAFGERLKLEVCLPHHMHMNECMELAIAIAREDYAKEAEEQARGAKA